MDAGGDSSDVTAKAPFRRKLFYIPGFDPFPPRRYREIYRAEAAAQSALGGYRVTLLPGREVGAGYGWRVEAHIEAPAEVAVEVLVWSDLVQHSMAGGVLQTYGQLGRTAWLYLRSGALGRLIRLRKGPMIAALYPAVALVLQLALAVLIGGLVVRGLAGLPFGLEWPLGAVAVWAVLEGARRLDRWTYTHYLMQDYAFATCAGGAYPAALSDRLAAFTARVRAALASGVDEVLVVGHSSGAQLAVTVLADALRAGVPPGGPALGLLTLGHAVPMVSFLPKAGRLRGDLAFLSASDRIAWVDVTAPGDGCSFALCDPVAVSGVAPPDQRWPLVISAAFSQTLSPARWRALRWRFFRLHFQYLHAFDNLPGRDDDYDYFRISAGALTLGERFRARKPSASRITRAANPYRGTA
jgi:hypothetical protein